MVGIYKITNKINGKCYIGQSKSIGGRWNQHIYQLENGTHANVELQYEYNSFGFSNFMFEIIEQCDESDLLSRERENINLNSENCYNIFNKIRNYDNESTYKVNGNVSKFVLDDTLNVSVVSQRIILLSYEEYNKTSDRNVEVSIKDYCECTGLSSRTLYNRIDVVVKELKKCNLYKFIDYSGGVFTIEIDDKYSNKDEFVFIGSLKDIVKNLSSKYTLSLLILLSLNQENKFNIVELKNILCDNKYKNNTMFISKVINPFVNDVNSYNDKILVEYINDKNRINEIKITL